MTLESNATFIVAPDLEITEVPDGVMIYQSARERVHYLNPTAAIVLELCGMGKTRDQIEQFLIDGFALADRPAAEVDACLENLLNEGLVTAS